MVVKNIRAINFLLLIKGMPFYKPNLINAIGKGNHKISFDYMVLTLEIEEYTLEKIGIKLSIKLISNFLREFLNQFRLNFAVSVDFLLPHFLKMSLHSRLSILLDEIIIHHVGNHEEVVAMLKF